MGLARMKMCNSAHCFVGVRRKDPAQRLDVGVGHWKQEPTVAKTPLSSISFDNIQHQLSGVPSRLGKIFDGSMSCRQRPAQRCGRKVCRTDAGLMWHGRTKELSKITGSRLRGRAMAR